MNQSRPPLVIGTRGSPLALAQAALAVAALERTFPGIATETRIITTSGDVPLVDLAAIKATRAGAKGLFTKEIEAALLNREIDIAVHSCKDLPAEMPESLTLAAVLERAATADILLSKEPRLPERATIGTSSIRRKRQLLHAHPRFEVIDIRGNVQTRLKKFRESETLDGLVLAQAGLERLGFSPASGTIETEQGVFYTTVLKTLPAIAQGAIALQTRREDAIQFTPLNHAPTLQAIRAERELMRLLDGGCDLPVGVRSTHFPDNRLRLEAILFDPDRPDAPPREAVVEGNSETPERIAQEAFKALREA